MDRRKTTQILSASSLEQAADGVNDLQREGSCEYTGESVTDIRKGVLLQLGFWTRG